MGIGDFINRILRGEESGGNKKSSNKATGSGTRVSVGSAMELPAIRAAMRILAEDVATVPRHLYRRGDSRVRAEDNHLYRILRDHPNRRMSGVEYREYEMLCLLAWGNAYAVIEFDPVFGTIPVGLWPMRPDRVSVLVREDGLRRYVYVSSGGEPITFEEAEVVHTMGLSDDGIVGQSPIAQYAESIGVHIAVRDYSASYFDNGGLWQGFVIHPNSLSDDAVEKLKKKLNDTSGLPQAHRWKVLREDMKVASVPGVSASEAQLLEIKQWTYTEAACMFRLPPHKLGDLSRATFSNIEAESTNYVTGSLRPWCVRIESSYQKRLIEPYGYEGDQLYMEHNLDGLVRGDLKSRYEAYGVGRQWGWLTANKVLQMENMETFEGGDRYLHPVNMVDASDPTPTTGNPPNTPGAPAASE